MHQRKQLQIPVGLLVLYDAGYKFKFKKYYLRKGKNSIGSDQQNHIKIEGVPGTAAAIVIKQDLACIQSLTDDSVHVPSNMIKKNSLMVQLNKGWRYVIQMQKDFYICKKRALVQISSLKQLLQIKGVENNSLFIKSGTSDDKSVHSDKTEKMEDQVGQQFAPTIALDQQNEFQATIPLDNNNFDATIALDENHGFQATIPLDQNHFQATIPLDNNNFGATLLMEQNNGGFQPTIPLDEHILASSSQRQDNLIHTQSRRIIRSSQFANVNPPSLSVSHNSVNLPSNRASITQNNKRESQNRSNILQASQRQISMPDTLNENQMPDTLNQDQMPATLQQADEMPATLQEFDSSSKKKMSMSVPTKSKTKDYDPFKKNFHSLDDKPKEINDFDDMFAAQVGLGAKTQQIFSSSLGSERSNKKKIINFDKKNQEKDSQKTQKMQQPNEQMIKSKKSTGLNSNKSQKSLKKTGILGCKKQEINLQILKQKGFSLVDHPQDSFDLLLIGPSGLKVCKRLMLALIQDKQIKSLSWIKDPNAKILGKIQGFPWEMIEKNKGKNKQIFNGRYYLQPQLREQFQEVIIKAGGQLQNKLAKNKAKMKISIIIDQKTQQGKQLYEQYHNYKNWKIYKKKMLVESIFVGEEIKEKYQIEDYQL